MYFLIFRIFLAIVSRKIGRNFENGATNRPMKIEATRLMTIAILSFVNKSGKNGQSFSGKKNIKTFYLFFWARGVSSIFGEIKTKTEARHLNFKFLIFPFIFLFYKFFFQFSSFLVRGQNRKIVKVGRRNIFKIFKNF